MSYKRTSIHITNNSTSQPIRKVRAVHVSLTPPHQSRPPLPLHNIMTVSVSCYKNQTLFTRPTPPLSTPLFAYRRTHTHPSHPPPPPQKPAHAHSTTDSLLWALRQPTQQQQLGDEKKESEKKKDRERNGVRVHREAQLRIRLSADLAQRPLTTP